MSKVALQAALTAFGKSIADVSMAAIVLHGDTGHAVELLEATRKRLHVVDGILGAVVKESGKGLLHVTLREAAAVHSSEGSPGLAGGVPDDEPLPALSSFM